MPAMPPAKQIHARHLRRARALVKQQKYFPAIEQFAAALEAVPNEPVALQEMGWAAFLAGDMNTADSASRGAIDFAGEDAKVKAAAHYTLGRVAEKQGDRAAAIRAGKEALRLHPDPAVRRWLDELE